VHGRILVGTVVLVSLATAIDEGYHGKLLVAGEVPRYVTSRVVRGAGEMVLFIWSANLEKGRDLEYKKFITKNLNTYKKHMPPGWTLKGIYGAAFNIGPGDVTWIWEMNKYADLDRAREYSDPVLDKLLSDEMDFYVPGSGATAILREVKDWVLVPPKKSKKSKR